MDDFEAKRIRESLKDKGQVSEMLSSAAGALKSFFLSNEDQEKLLGMIKKINDRVENFTQSNRLTEGSSSRPPMSSEPSSHLPKKIFGRDKDIDLLLDMIIGRPNNRFGFSNQEQPQSSWKFMRNIKKFITNSLQIIDEIASTTTEVAFITEDFRWSTYALIHDTRNSFRVGNRNLEVLPIVGMGGIGKTTIAQTIYNHPRVEYFELRGWVYVKDRTDPITLINDIVLSFHVENSNYRQPISSLNEGHNRLMSAMKKRRFLLILDDVRVGIDLTWKKLLPVLAEGALGSIVVVTTQSESVAKTIGTLPYVSIDVLEWQYFLPLFEHHALGNQNILLSPEDETELKLVGEEIAKKLHCLPLAAETIGTMLSNKLDINYWEEIKESDWWNHQNIKNNILPSLGVGFQNLDLDLKQCFIFCSLFPKNYVFDKSRLVQMWIAHGFIQPTETEQHMLERGQIKIDDIGNSRFDKLVDRFFFQTTIWENRYVMHDLIRELAIAVSSAELYVSSKDLMNNSVPSFPRHLAIDADVDANFYVDNMHWNEDSIKGLRTIMFFGFCKQTKDKGIHNILYKLTSLRVLDLSYFRYQISLPDEVIGQLSHIRFLDLSFSNITSIPKSIRQLVHLQVLNIRGCRFNQLPRKMNQLINLRHLYASPETISLIFGIGKLKNLQELEEFNIREEEGFTIRELMDMDFLGGQLALGSLNKVPSKEEAASARLDKKKYLTSLSLRYDGFSVSAESIKKSVKHLEILESLKPHKNIRELMIRKFMWFTFPYWLMEIHEINNLRSIELIHCFYLKTLPPLGSLPKLEVLILNALPSITCIGEELNGNSDVIFPSLKELEFIRLREWEHWSYPGKRKMFPCLQKVKIDDCHKLSAVPLQCLNSSVKELNLSDCDIFIKNFGSYFQHMTSLTRLYLNAYDWLTLDLLCGDHLRGLQVLALGDIEIPHVEGKISSLTSLKKLIFPKYRQRISSSVREHLQYALQAECRHSCLSLSSIEVHNFCKIPKVLFSLGRFPSLRTLWISNCVQERFTTMEDCWLEGLTSLEEMELSDCMNLECLPPSLSTMSALKTFTLESCPKILSFPHKGLPRSLKELHIRSCSAALMQGCEPIKGAEWPKISHIPYIRVGKQTVQYSDDLH